MSKTLAPPKIFLGQGHRIEYGKEAAFNLFNQPIFDPKHKLRVGLIYFDRVDVS